MIQIGDIVTTRQTGTDLWVVRAVAGEGSRAHLRGKLIDHRGRATYTDRVSGLGDIAVIVPAATYTPGQQVELDGVRLTVTRDLGDVVEFSVPEKRFEHAAGVNVRLPAGNSITISKAELALDALI